MVLKKMCCVKRTLWKHKLHGILERLWDLRLAMRKPWLLLLSKFRVVKILSFQEEGDAPRREKTVLGIEGFVWWSFSRWCCFGSLAFGYWSVLGGARLFRLVVYIHLFGLCIDWFKVRPNLPFPALFFAWLLGWNLVYICCRGPLGLVLCSGAWA